MAEQIVAEREARHLVDGRSLDAAESTSTVVDPFTQDEVGSVPHAGPGVVDEAVRIARAAAPAWAATDPADRAEVLRRWADLIDAHAESIAATVTAEMGMPTALARASQADLPATVLRAFADIAGELEWASRGEGMRVDRLPLGVVAAITPWNMPVHQIVAKVGAALAAGNTVVLKPSELTPFDALEVARLALEAGLPPAALGVVHGTGPGTGQLLAGSPGVDHVSFTGSVPGGRAVAATAAGHLGGVTLELGGKSAAVLLDDADLGRVVPAVVRSAFVNSGQACNATTRLVVPRARHDDVIDLLRVAVKAQVLGDPRDPATTLGPLVSRRHRDRVLAMLAGEGAASEVIGAEEVPQRGWFVAPRVLVGLDRSHSLAREEIFGPVAVLLTYGDEAEAVEVAADSEFGLSAEVWSADPDRARRLAGELRVGQVKINGVRTRERPRAPFGGFGASGHGRELGTEGVLGFTTTRAVLS